MGRALATSLAVVVASTGDGMLCVCVRRGDVNTNLDTQVVPKKDIWRKNLTTPSSGKLSSSSTIEIAVGSPMSVTRSLL